jgi:hypothetical protein
MRRPVRVKTVLFLLLWILCLRAEPPLSPSFHPHSFVSDCRSVPGGCSRFSRRCYLIIDLCSHLFGGSWAPGLSRSLCLPKMLSGANAFKISDLQEAENGSIARPSSQARLLAPSLLRTVRNTFALHGSSTQQRPLNERGRSLIQVQFRPTRYWATADSHCDGKIHQACGKLHQRLAPSSTELHRFHKRSRVRAPAKSLLRFRRRDVVPNRRRNLYLRYYNAAFASFRAPIPTSPLSASRLPTPRLWGTIRAYSVPLE